jgi:hypothetical protein
MSISDLKYKPNVKVETENKARAQRLEKTRKCSEATRRELPQLVHGLYVRIRATLDDTKTIHILEEPRSFV